MTIWQPDLSRFKGPRYRAIADAIAEDVRSGKLTADYRMPTHRDLADELGVTVGTVTRGYAEAARRGLLKGVTGRGTFVAGNSEPVAYFTHADDNPQTAVDMGMTLPLNHLDPNLSQVLRSLADQPDLQSSLYYYPSKGRYLDREVGARWLRNYNLDLEPDQVMLTAGGQHAIATVICSMFRPGDLIAVDQITYPLFKTAAHRFHLKLYPVPMDAEGMLPEALSEICENHPVVGIYCMPTFHNPTTAVMSQQRREAIVSIAREYDLQIIEDEAYALLYDQPYSPLCKLAPERTFLVASLSKAVTCGLRYGYLVCPPQYNRRIEQSVADLMWMVSPVAARIARHLIDEGTALETIHKKRVEARQRNELVHAILGGFHYQSQATSYFVWLHLPEPWNSADFAREASEHGVIVTPEEYFVVGRSNRLNSVRIAISGPSRMKDLEKGLQVIRNLLGNS